MKNIEIRQKAAQIAMPFNWMQMIAGGVAVGMCFLSPHPPGATLAAVVSGFVVGDAVRYWLDWRE